MIIYTVKRGDTLWNIARSLGTTMDSIIKVNDLQNPEQLVVGQNLLIPTPEDGVIFRYVVQPGDTLFTIARLFNVSVQSIAISSDLNIPYTIFPGQVLNIPLRNLRRYTVRPGDTLWQIARRFNVGLNQLIALNNLTPPYIIYPGQTILIPGGPEMPRPLIETVGFLIPGDLEDTLRIVDITGETLTYVPIFSFPVNSQGDIAGEISPEIISAIKASGALPLAVISNFDGTTFDRDLAHTVLSSPELRNRVIANTLVLLSKYRFSGVTVDFENMPPEDRALYTEFIDLLTRRLKAFGYIVSLAAAPKYADWPDRPWVGAFDYRALGQIVDFVFIMTYEWGWIGGPPNAIAPLPLVRRVLEYALGLIPANKIIMGIPVYGYNWELPDTPENLATSVTLSQAWELARRFNTSILWSEYAQSPYFTYIDERGQQHEVWFEDIRSHNEKYSLAKSLRIRGVGYWQLNDIFISTLYLLNNLFQVRQGSEGF